jgi:hypothetical protein
VAMIDHRLADMTLLLLAAKRRQAKRAVPDWRTCEGLSALLEAARRLPPRDPCDVPTLDTTTGLGKLLAEARQKGGARGT